MSGVTTRDALTKAFHDDECTHGGPGWSDPDYRECAARADALLTSGAVVDVAALADDEALRWNLADKIALAYEGEGEAWPGGDRLAAVAADVAARHFTRALAAALKECAS